MYLPACTSPVLYRQHLSVLVNLSVKVLQCGTRLSTVRMPCLSVYVTELENDKLTEGDSLIIECTQVSPKHGMSLPSASTDDSAISDQSQSPPSITHELSDATVTVGQPAELVMKTSGRLVAVSLAIAWLYLPLVVLHYVGRLWYKHKHDGNFIQVVVLLHFSA